MELAQAQPDLPERIYAEVRALKISRHIFWRLITGLGKYEAKRQGSDCLRVSSAAGPAF
jgi:hypothetical protein